MKKKLIYIYIRALSEAKLYIETFKKILSAIVYLLSEFESLIVEPKGFVLLRIFFLKLNNVDIGKKIFFGNGFHLYKKKYKLKIGNRACFGEKCGIYVHGDIEIGDDFLAAPGLTINNGTHDLEILNPGSKSIKIGSRVWCGVNVTILSGAEIGDDCVIGANSLVRCHIPNASIAVGVPAKVIKTQIRKSEFVWSCFK